LIEGISHITFIVKDLVLATEFFTNIFQAKEIYSSGDKHFLCQRKSYLRRIKALGIDIKPERPRVNGEGRAIYFYDFDNYLFELHTGTIEERLKRYSFEIHV